MTDKIPESPSRMKNGMNPLNSPYKGKEGISNSSSTLFLRRKNSRKFNGSNSFPKINKFPNVKETTSSRKDEDTKKLNSPLNLRINTEKFHYSKEDSSIHRANSNIISPAYRRSPLVYDFSYPHEKENKMYKPVLSPVVSSSPYPYHSPQPVRPASPNVSNIPPLSSNKKSTILLNNDYDNFYKNPIKFQRYSPTSTHLAGWLLLFITYVVFVLGMYSVIFSKIMSDTGNPVLDSIKHDKYYCYLIPLLIVVIYLFIFVNWFSMKFFRHN